MQITQKSHIFNASSEKKSINIPLQINISSYMIRSYPLQLVGLDYWIGLGKRISSDNLEVKTTSILLWVPMSCAVYVSTAALESLSRSNYFVAARAPILQQDKKSPCLKVEI